MPLKSTLGASEGFGYAAVALNEAPTHIDPADVRTRCHEDVSAICGQSSYTCADTTAYMSGSLTISGISHTPAGVAPVALDEAPTHIDPANVLNSSHEGLSVTSDQNSYTCVDTPVYMSGSPTVSEIPHTPAVVQHQGQRTSRAKTDSILKTRKGLTAASSRTSRRAGGIRGTPNGPNSCGVQGCKKKDQPYKLLSGLRRHYQDKHCEPTLCTLCDRDVFEWTRPYQLKDHLEKKHPKADRSAALVEAKRTRRRATI